ncbi:hypothetical protein M9Y10_035659 [Tritrichomonas musculus]|uniref:Protein kinase domain-containing protein n=1 Tax=Tritrichomonas musculus TaxID=1915356 RepID=A0ABR2GWF6_9EUKA
MSCKNILPVYHYIVEENRPPKIKKINQYILISKLGTGYFSKVYLAVKYDENKKSSESEKTKESYFAAKAIHVHQSVQSSADLEREVKMLRKLNHPNIIKFYKLLYAPSTDIAYIIMEWANCGTLQQAISKKIKFDEKTLASIFIQIALALSYLHSTGTVHRDVKPSNILLFSDGTAKLSDFGISHSLESAESVFGTPSYQAPDIFDEVDSKILSKYHSVKNKDGSQFNSLKTHLEQKNLYLHKYNKTHPIYNSGITFHVQKSNISTFSMRNNPKATNEDDIYNEDKDVYVANNSNYKKNVINLNDENNNKKCNSYNDVVKESIDYSYIKEINNEDNSKNNDKFSNKCLNNCCNTAISDKSKTQQSSTESSESVSFDEKESWKNDPKKSDVWSLGISMYQTAFGILPYEGKNMYEIINNINNSDLIIPENNERQYSILFVDLIVKMLKKNPNERISINEVIQHPFFVHFQSAISDKQTDSKSIIICKDREMQKVSFDIKPIQPPKYLTSQVVKIDTIVCPENYSFQRCMKHPLAPNNRYSFIDDNE